MNAKLDGPKIYPANGTKPKKLVVILHGYGADGNDLISIGNYWAEHYYNEALFISPNAHQRCMMSPMGYQWFPITNIDFKEISSGVKSAAPIVKAFIDEQLNELDLNYSDLILTGFSQGCMLALYAGLTLKEAPACIIGFSGALADSDQVLEYAKHKPPILLTHGDQDPVVPHQHTIAANEALLKAGFDVTMHISKGLMHGIDADGIHLGGDFIKKHLG